jgi:hypothetical protein
VTRAIVGGGFDDLNISRIKIFTTAIIVINIVSAIH